MTNNWALPRTIEQFSEPGTEEQHISWLEVDNFSSLKYPDGRSVRTVRDLVHIARDPRHDIKEKTYFLKLTNFNFHSLPDTITGIQLRVSMNRFGRITDDVIKLWSNDVPTGENQASRSLSPVKIYGQEDSIWGTELGIEDVQDPDFGVILRFKSHPDWPHKSSALIDSVELRIL
jgi:hypothetical protein